MEDKELKEVEKYARKIANILKKSKAPYLCVHINDESITVTQNIWFVPIKEAFNAK